MTPVELRPSLDGDRTYLRVGTFVTAYCTERTLQQVLALWNDLGVPIELVPIWLQCEPPPEASGAEVSEE